MALASLLAGPGWSGAPTNGTSRAGSIISTREAGDDNLGSLWYCAVAGSPGTWKKLAGPATAGAFHVLPSTIRVWDSRPGLPPLSVPKGPLANGATDVIDCTLGGAVPVGATAVMVNLTIAGTSAAGFLAAFKNGISWPGNSSINWSTAGLTTANLVVVALDAQARFALRANRGCSTDFVVDVMATTTDDLGHASAGRPRAQAGRHQREHSSALGWARNPNLLIRRLSPADQTGTRRIKTCRCC